MPSMRHTTAFFLLALTMISPAFAEPVPVKIVPGKGITRGGEPYFVKGAGGEKHCPQVPTAL
jgi:hypothetical protein